jgi:hypothetical protein
MKRNENSKLTLVIPHVDRRNLQSCVTTMENGTPLAAINFLDLKTHPTASKS